MRSSARSFRNLPAADHFEHMRTWSFAAALSASPNSPSGRGSYGARCEFVWRFQSVENGTLVTIRCEDVPMGIDPEHHQAGLISTLNNLAAFVAVLPDELIRRARRAQGKSHQISTFVKSLILAFRIPRMITMQEKAMVEPRTFEESRRWQRILIRNDNVANHTPEPPCNQHCQARASPVP